MRMADTTTKTTLRETAQMEVMTGNGRMVVFEIGSGLELWSTKGSRFADEQVIATIKRVLV